MLHSLGVLLVVCGIAQSQTLLPVSVNSGSNNWIVGSFNGAFLPMAFDFCQTETTVTTVKYTCTNNTHVWKQTFDATRECGVTNASSTAWVMNTDKMSGSYESFDCSQSQNGYTHVSFSVGACPSGSTAYPFNIYAALASCSHLPEYNVRNSTGDIQWPYGNLTDVSLQIYCTAYKAEMQYFTNFSLGAYGGVPTTHCAGYNTLPNVQYNSAYPPWTTTGATVFYPGVVSIITGTTTCDNFFTLWNDLSTGPYATEIYGKMISCYPDGTNMETKSPTTMPTPMPVAATTRSAANVPMSLVAVFVAFAAVVPLL